MNYQGLASANGPIKLVYIMHRNMAEVLRTCCTFAVPTTVFASIDDTQVCACFAIGALLSCSLTRFHTSSPLAAKPTGRRVRTALSLRPWTANPHSRVDGVFCRGYEAMFSSNVVDALGIVSMRSCASRSDREGSCIVLLWCCSKRRSVQHLEEQAMKRQGNETEYGRIKFEGRYPPGYYISPDHSTSDSGISANDKRRRKKEPVSSPLTMPENVAD